MLSQGMATQWVYMTSQGAHSANLYPNPSRSQNGSYRALQGLSNCRQKNGGICPHGGRMKGGNAPRGSLGGVVFDASQYSLIRPLEFVVSLHRCTLQGPPITRSSLMVAAGKPYERTTILVHHAKDRRSAI